MGLISMMPSFFGCSKKPASPSRPQEELSSVSIAQSHMDRTYCFSFCARKSDNGYFLDADCMIVDYDNNDCKEIKYEDTEISEDDFLKFSELDSKYDFLAHKKVSVPKNNIFFANDETITSFSVRYGEESFSIETNGECFSAVNNYFFELAEKYAE